MKKYLYFTILTSVALFFATPMIGALSEAGEDASQGGILAGIFQRLLANTAQEELAVPLAGEEQDQINLLFLGIGGQEHISGNYLTDTIILVVLTPGSGKAAAISIPRDLIVRAPNGSRFMRINALYAMYPPLLFPQEDRDPGEFPGPMGITYTKDAVEKVTGVVVDYYVVVDLQAVEKVVTTLGGIVVPNINDPDDSKIPGEIDEAGLRHLNGTEAAKYIRVRHTPGGDFDRMKRQHQVIFAIKEKVASLKSFSSIPKLFSLYQTLQDHFYTDLSFRELVRLKELGEDIGTDAILSERITGQKGNLLVSSTEIWSGKEAYVLIPRAGKENYEEIHEKVEGIIEDIGE